MLWAMGQEPCTLEALWESFISVWPALLQAIEIHWPALATVTKINSRGSLDHSWLSSGGGPKGDMSAPQGGLLEVCGGRE